MIDKKQCLAHFLEASVEIISSDGNSGLDYNYQDKKYKVMTWQEANREFKNFLIENLWDFDVSAIANYIDLPEHVDKNEFIESLSDVGSECQGQANPLFWALIADVDDFVSHIVENYYEEDLGGIFANDGKQHYSETYDLFIYKIQ